MSLSLSLSIKIYIYICIIYAHLHAYTYFLCFCVLHCVAVQFLNTKAVIWTMLFGNMVMLLPTRHRMHKNAYDTNVLLSWRAIDCSTQQGFATCIIIWRQAISPMIADALYKGTPNTSQVLQILQTVGGLGTISPGLTFSQNAHGQIYLQQRIVYLLKVFIVLVIPGGVLVFLFFTLHVHPHPA